jgi:hypothetical protein
MARIFIDGFEGGGMDLWDVVFPNSVSVDSSISGRTGTYCMKAGSINGYMCGKNFNHSSLYIAYKIRQNTSDSNTVGGIQFWSDNSSTQLGGLQLSSSPKFYWGSAASNLVGTSSISPGINTFYLVEIYYLPHLTSGAVTVKINGNIAIEVSGVKTAPSTTNIGQIWFNYSNSIGFYVDDFIVDDANWIGNTKIQAIVPTGAGATTGLTPSTGNNWDAVNELPASDTDYVKGSSGLTDTYVMGNLEGSISSIKSVAVQSRNWREGNGSYDRAQHIVRPASTDRLSASKTAVFPITAGSFQSIWELNPEDSAAWEEADVNGMEAGIKLVTA